MSNQDAPFGLVPYNPSGGTPRKEVFYAGTTTSIFRGDIVCIAANGRVHTLTTATGDEEMIGVAANFVDATTAPGSTTAQKCWVYTDPEQRYIVQDDGDGAPAWADVGATAAIVATTGNTTTGQGKQELDISSLTTTSTKPLKVLGFKTGPSFEVGDYAKYIVKLNINTLNSFRAGI